MAQELTQEQALLDHLSRMEKAQYVRLFDVFILAPVMVYVGYNKQLSPNLNALFLLTGIGTALFNGANYIKIEQLKKSLGN